MELWIARERIGDVWFYKEKPLYNMEKGKFEGDLILISMDDDIFPEVTFENSPKRVELKLVEEL